jgi:voltage-dependent calcium channel T type alpha-1G
MFFKIDDKFRVRVTKIVTHNFFERIMLAIIFVTTLQLAVDNPLSDPTSFIQQFLFWLDVSLTVIFMAEAIMKIIAYGFVFCGSTSYIRSSWNALDLTIVVISVTSLMLPTTNLNSIKVIRLMKILRPLRVISRNQGLKISIRTLGVALPGIFNVILVTFLFLFICGIIGVNYFKGRLYDCFADSDVMSAVFS